MFCGILLKPNERIRNSNLPNYWKQFIGINLNIEEMQKAFAQYWKPFMEPTSVGMQDTTCYENRIAFPIDVRVI